MVAKTQSRKPKSKNTRSARAKPASPKVAKAPPPEQAEQQPSPLITDEKVIRSLQSLASFIALGAWLGILAGIFLIWSMISYRWGISAIVSIVLVFAISGVLFWCSKLLEQKSQLAITVYTVTMIASWVIVLITRLASSRPLLGARDLLSLIVPGIILFEMYRLRQKKVLV